MGTHPIFESDFDCLTDMRILRKQIRNFQHHGRALEWTRHTLTPEYRYRQNVLYAQTKENKHHYDMGEWTRNNNMIYPPRKPGEPRRPFEIYWGRANVNAEIDGNAFRRLCFSMNNLDIEKAIAVAYNLRRREGYHVYETLRDAQIYASYEVEYAQNMHVGECFAVQHHMAWDGQNKKTEMMNIYVLLREGPAPPNRSPLKTEDAIDYYLELHRNKTVPGLW